MTIGTVLAIFEDFNEPSDQTPPPPVEEPPAGDIEIDRIRTEAWTEGFMTGRQGSATRDGDPVLTARLLTSVHELDNKASDAVAEAALIVADLLVNTVITVTSDEWAARLLERVRMVAERVKPALTIAPEFILHDAGGPGRRFGDMAALSHALEAGDTNQDVSIRWHHGEAMISREALLDDLREAIIPLSAGLTPAINHEQPSRQQT
jgi:hypothetical protein